MEPWRGTLLIALFLVWNGDIASSRGLVLGSDEVRDLLVLRLLDGTLIRLVTLTQELLLDEVNSLRTNFLVSVKYRLSSPGITYLIEEILVLLTLFSTPGSAVQLVAKRS